MKEPLLKTKPILYRGAISHWPALTKWTNNYLKEVFQASPAMSLFALNKDFQRKRLTNHTTSSAFEQVINNTHSAQRFYMSFQPLIHNEKLLLQDIEVPSWVTNKRFHMSNIWVGQNMSLTPLHYDSIDGYLCQIVGHKRVYLLAPEDSLYLYPKSPLTGGRFNFSEVAHFHEVPLNTHAHLLRANLYSFLLGPGDSLYIPYGWWHQVYNLSYSVATNFFFTNEARGYSAKQEILMFQACKSLEKSKINEILKYANYDNSLENAVSLLEENCLEYACYSALLVFEEYLKAHFARYFFELLQNGEHAAQEIQTLVSDLYNTQQSDRERYYYLLTTANEYLLVANHKAHIPVVYLNKWIELSLKVSKGDNSKITSGEILTLICEIKKVCIHDVHRAEKAGANLDEEKQRPSHNL